MFPVGFVGLGSQGGPMVWSLLRAGWPVTVWARRDAVAVPFAAEGAKVAETLRELGRASHLVGVCVRNDDDVLSVALEHGLVTGMSPGSVLAIHSTVHPRTCEAVRDAAATRGVHVLDAPVSGGRRGAEDGSLAVMVGGDPNTFEQVRAAFATFGVPSLLGPLGSGQVAKLINNALMTANLGLADSALDIAAALGLDRDAMTELLPRTSGRSSGLDTLIRVRRSGSKAALELLSKDVGHFTALSAELGPLAEGLAAAAEHGLAVLRET